MSHTTHTSSQILWELMQKINRCWYEKRFEELDDYFHETIVFNSPDLKHQATGRTMCIQSYVDFMENSTVLLYWEGNPHVHIFENTAIINYDFEMRYEQQGKVFHDTGTDILVFNRHGDTWKAVWRTMTNLKNA
ncbi:DUF4440 domain-containing protein [Parapedobacter sp. DT-150]|uniref:DUF4440 domain-containing protein n=1 Tax=Parapedobacter sp. DT-150 TaxID=3396162 RepID=UPI003F19A480